MLKIIISLFLRILYSVYPNRPIGMLYERVSAVDLQFAISRDY